MPAPSDSARPSPRLLVVDDNEMNRDMLSRRLKRRKFEVEVADSGEAALARLLPPGQDPGIDLVLLDVMMPGVDGLEVLRQLRENYSNTELPVVMATAKDTSEDVVEALKLGANDYVTKPLDFPVVQARVKAQLALKEAHDELERRNAFIKKVFGRYVTDDVVTRLLETEEGLKFGGERRVLTLLMSDVRGFSALCERLDPEQVVEMLNIYLGAMAEVVATFHGTIDEFIGDAILAIFGAPFDLPDHQERAIACAICMQQSMKGVNTLLAEKGLPTLEMGIGINTGAAVVGNIGSDRRAKYGVVGSTVNLCGRIESYTVGGQVLVGRDTAEGLGDRLTVRRTFQAAAKGIDGAFEILDVRGITQAAFSEDHRQDLMLSDDDEKTEVLAKAWPVRLALLEGKHLAEAEHDGELSELSPRGAVLHTQVSFSVLANLRLRLGEGEAEGEVYAKVLEAEGGRSYIRFTSVSPQAKALIYARLH